MGNSSLYGVSCHSKQLGRYAAVEVDKLEDGRKNVRMWDVLLTVDGSNSELELKCFSGTGGKIRKVMFELSGDIWSDGYIKFSVRKSEKDLLKSVHFETYHNEKDITLHISGNRNINAWGGVTEWNNYVYWCGRKGGLLVMELKKRSEDEEPYKLTVAHYYYAVADSGRNLFDLTGTDIGLSVIAKIQVSNDVGLDIVVEQGPEEHPAAALLYMFDQIRKTGIWKPTICPHCANTQKKQRAAADMSSQSESEDNNYFPPPRRLHCPGQNAGGAISINNSGVSRGNYNGSFINLVRRANFFDRGVRKL